MKPKLYKPTPFGEFEIQEVAQVLDSLTGEAKEYIDMLSAQLVVLMKAKGATSFGKDQAREIVGQMIIKGEFTPAPLKG